MYIVVSDSAVRDNHGMRAVPQIMFLSKYAVSAV